MKVEKITIQNGEEIEAEMVTCSDCSGTEFQVVIIHGYLHVKCANPVCGRSECLTVYQIPHLHDQNGEPVPTDLILLDPGLMDIIHEQPGEKPNRILRKIDDLDWYQIEGFPEVYVSREDFGRATDLIVHPESARSVKEKEHWIKISRMRHNHSKEKGWMAPETASETPPETPPQAPANEDPQVT